MEYNNNSNRLILKMLHINLSILRQSFATNPNSLEKERPKFKDK